jgi:cytochrome b561/polyisoprenoid-binding protein YceI
MVARRYSQTAMALHWTIALAFAFQLALGWRLEDIPKGPGLFSAYQLHKSVGITILVLTFVRLAIRITHSRPPAMSDDVWAARMAHAVHWLFYLALLLGPIAGWVIVSTATIKVPTLIFGAIPWPHLPIPLSWQEPAEGVHAAMAWLGFGLFFLHVAGALRHQFMKDENILGRMIPLLKTGSISKMRAAIAAGLAIIAVWAAHGAGWKMPFGPQSAANFAKVPEAAPGPAPKAKMVEETPVSVDAIDNESAIQPLSDWRVLPGGRLGFTANWSGTSVSGSFGRWDSRIRFTPDALEKTTIRVLVDLRSVNTGDSQRDESLNSRDFFETATYPDAMFSTVGIRALSNDRYEARGVLEFHGKKHPLTIVFTMKIKNGTARVRGSARLDRTMFGVGSGEWASTDQIAANVAVSFNFIATRMSAN